MITKIRSKSKKLGNLKRSVESKNDDPPQG